MYRSEDGRNRSALASHHIADVGDVQSDGYRSLCCLLEFGDSLITATDQRYCGVVPIMDLKASCFVLFSASQASWP